MSKIGIIGSGSFGCALAYILNKNNNEVKIWSYTKEEKELINNEHKCMYLNNFILDEKIICSNNYEEVIKDANYIILVTPSHVIRKTCKEIKKYITNQKIIIASKGMEEDKTLSQIVNEELNVNSSVILGPSHAEQIIKNIPTFIEYSGNKEINKLFENDNFKLTYNEDIIGMEIAAALKNIIAIIVGVVEGLDYESNTISYVITKGLEEISLIGQALNAKKDTFYGLSGLGDLLTTSFSMDSRNKKAGLLLAKNKSVEEIKKEIGMTIEGLDTLLSSKKIIDKYNLDCKLINNLYEIVYNNGKIENII